MVREEGGRRDPREHHRRRSVRSGCTGDDLLQLNLPPVPDRRLAVRVTPDALRQIRGGHPWLYADSITEVSEPGASAGTLAVVFDAKRRFAAIGLWDPTSPIRVRILHVGHPRIIDDDHWTDVVVAAASRRAVIDTEATTGYRLLNGENDGVGGLVADRYGDSMVVKLYTPAWLPHLGGIVAALTGMAGAEHAVLRISRNLRDHNRALESDVRDGLTILGASPGSPVPYRENGLEFTADVERGQKTGSFLDQRDNRQRVRQLARGRTVLDVFSGTGGFSVHAAAGGARTVHVIDQSSHALSAARHHMRINAEATGSSFRATEGDAFAAMEQLTDRGERYELVIVDPPAFTSSSSTVGRARRAYRRLGRLALQLLEPGGILVQASCSARIGEDDLLDEVSGAAEDVGRRLRDIDVTGHGVDHPVTFPEGRYLKAVFATVP